MVFPSFSRKNVLVTGAASGIGRATALAFAAEGAQLFITDIDPAGLATLQAAIGASGQPCFAWVADVSDAAQMQRLAAAVHEIIPALDVLVNNAGIGFLGSFSDTPASVWQRMLQVNLMGVVHGCQCFLPQMRQAGGPRHILNVASLAGVAPAPNMSAYAASKHAVMGLCDALALELAGSAVRVSAVCPGVIDTAITDGPHAQAIGDAQLARLRGYYKAHGGRPEHVAAAMLSAVRHGRDLVLAGPHAKPAYHLKRFSRALLRKLTLVDAARSGYI